MWHCAETSFWDWLVWINQLMRNHSSNGQNMLMYSTAMLDQVNSFLRTLMRILRFLRTSMRILHFLRTLMRFLRKKKETVVPPILLITIIVNMFQKSCT